MQEAQRRWEECRRRSGRRHTAGVRRASKDTGPGPYGASTWSLKNKNAMPPARPHPTLLPRPTHVEAGAAGAKESRAVRLVAPPAPAAAWRHDGCRHGHASRPPSRSAQRHQRQWVLRHSPQQHGLGRCHGRGAPGPVPRAKVGEERAVRAVALAAQRVLRPKRQARVQGGKGAAVRVLLQQHVPADAGRSRPWSHGGRGDRVVVRGAAERLQHRQQLPQLAARRRPGRVAALLLLLVVVVIVVVLLLQRPRGAGDGGCPDAAAEPCFRRAKAAPAEAQLASAQAAGRLGRRQDALEQRHLPVLRHCHSGRCCSGSGSGPCARRRHLCQCLLPRARPQQVGAHAPLAFDFAHADLRAWWGEAG